MTTEFKNELKDDLVIEGDVHLSNNIDENGDTNQMSDVIIIYASSEKEMSNNIQNLKYDSKKKLFEKLVILFYDILLVNSSSELNDECNFYFYNKSKRLTHSFKFNDDVYENCSLENKLNIMIYILSKIGYLTVYDHELVLNIMIVDNNQADLTTVFVKSTFNFKNFINTSTAQQHVEHISH